MGIFTIELRHLRFAVKLACAVVLALFVGFHFQLETPRWAVLTAAIVAAGPAFAAGGEPYSGAIRYRGMLRIVGTFIGCIAALAIIILMIRAPLLMVLVCCLWAGFCTGSPRWCGLRTPMRGVWRVIPRSSLLSLFTKSRCWRRSSPSNDAVRLSSVSSAPLWPICCFLRDR